MNAPPIAGVHMPRATRSSQEAADDVIEIAHSYLK